MREPSENSRVKIKSDIKNSTARWTAEKAQPNRMTEIKHRSEDNSQNKSWRTKGTNTK